MAEGAVDKITGIFAPIGDFLAKLPKNLMDPQTLQLLLAGASGTLTNDPAFVERVGAMQQAARQKKQQQAALESLSGRKLPAGADPAMVQPVLLQTPQGIVATDPFGQSSHMVPGSEAAATVPKGGYPTGTAGQLAISMAQRKTGRQPTAQEAWAEYPEARKQDDAEKTQRAVSQFGALVQPSAQKAEATATGRLNAKAKQSLGSADPNHQWFDTKTGQRMGRDTVFAEAQKTGVPMNPSEASVYRRLLAAQALLQQIKNDPALLKQLPTETGYSVFDAIKKGANYLRLKGKGSALAQKLKDVEVLVNLDLAGPLGGMNRIPVTELTQLKSIFSLTPQTQEAAIQAMSDASEATQQGINFALGRTGDMPAMLRGGAAASSPATGLQPGEMHVIRKSDGQHGAIPAAEFDPALYERVP